MFLPLLLAHKRRVQEQALREVRSKLPRIRKHMGRWECTVVDPLDPFEWWHEGRTMEEAYNNWVSGNGFVRRVKKS